MKRAYYEATLIKFLQSSEDEILGELARNNQYTLEDLQRNAWMAQVQILQQGLNQFKDYPTAHIALEYSVPRMGKRVDVIVFLNGIVFVLEFKVGDKDYKRYAVDQVVGYSLDLKNFHNASHHLTIVPILIATAAPEQHNNIRKYEDDVYYPIKCNRRNYSAYIGAVIKQAKQNTNISAKDWIDSPYKPTPNIIEAAQALYAGHQVEDISRSDASAFNLKLTAQSIFDIVDSSKANGYKSICFVTGVPGAGKTLAGLNIANKRYTEKNGEHAVFLSGNVPLVSVLQEALARDAVDRAKAKQKPIKKSAALSEAKTFIQNIHHFRDEYLSNETPPSETVAIFDEAQRAWTLEQTQKFMQKKRNILDFDQSEPEFLISVLDRHESWAVIVCLIGNGQEIHTGEAGISEWFASVNKSFNHWHIYVSEQLDNTQYNMCKEATITTKPGLHLSVPIRSYRSEKVSAFVHALLEENAIEAKAIFNEIENYPIVITRDITQAKRWINSHARAEERTGIIASSSGGRLKPYGINVKEKIDPQAWFLNDKYDVRSSNFLELIATEFDIQGLELDWACVAWDADLRHAATGWEYKNFMGTAWRNVNNTVRQNYLLNSYRVLLTRARQGMVIFVPEGDVDNIDETRRPEFYDSIYNYLLACGITEI
ncbi:MAG: DUF2075 domain-containing protein [Proteobacteria bacterium]|nr:DUF2075 domain-containing protein [Pseudomonadota bacterium]